MKTKTQIIIFIVILASVAAVVIPISVAYMNIEVEKLFNFVDLVFAINTAYGQTENLTKADTLALINSATKYESPYLVIIDGSGVYSSYIGIILDHYIASGYEIKTIQGTTIFMEKK